MASRNLEPSSTTTFSCFPRLPLELREEIWGLAVQNRTRAPEAHSFRVGKEHQEYDDALLLYHDHCAKWEQWGDDLDTKLGAPAWSTVDREGDYPWDTADNPSAYLMSAGLWFACTESRRAIYRCWAEYDNSQVPGLARYLASARAEIAAKRAHATRRDKRIWPLETELDDYDYEYLKRYNADLVNKSDRYQKRQKRSPAYPGSPPPYRRPAGLGLYTDKVLRRHTDYFSCMVKEGPHQAWVTTRPQQDLLVFQLDTPTTFSRSAILESISSNFFAPSFMIEGGDMSPGNIGIEYESDWKAELEDFESREPDWEPELGYPFGDIGDDSKVANLIMELTAIEEHWPFTGNFWFISNELSPAPGLKYEDLVFADTAVFLARGRRYIEVTESDLGSKWYDPGASFGVLSKLRDILTEHQDSCQDDDRSCDGWSYRPDVPSRQLKFRVLACLRDDR